MKIYQKILLCVVIGLVAFPTITLGGSFVLALIQGRTVEEAIQILAGQIDSLTERVETLENKQDDQEQNIEETPATSTDTNEEYLEREAREAFNLGKPKGTVTVTDPPIEDGE